MSILCLTSACALAQNSSISNNRVYLILSHHPDSLINDSLKNECERFAEWKRTKGFRAYALSGNWTDQAVLDVINEYKTDEDSVKYILFVGNSYLGHQCAYNLTTYTFEDDSTTYSFLLGDNYTTYSDYYYECKGDTTKNPTIRCGRIPVNYAREAINVFDKIIAYEQNPTNNETFYKTYLSCAAFDAHGPYEIWHGYERGRCIHSSENICNLLANTIFRAKTKRVYLHTALSSGYTNNVYGYHNCDVFDDGAAFPSFLQNPAWWTGDTDAINDSINAGAFLMTYLGDGYSQTWQQREIAYQPDVVLYSVMDTIGLNNDNKYPVLMSMSRKSGKYDEATDCPAEFFLKKHHGGAVAVIAPTEEAYPGFKEYLAEGFVQALFSLNQISPFIPLLPIDQNTPYELGELLAASKEWIQNKKFYHPRTHELTADSTYRKICPDYYNFQRDIFHLYGDPSMMVYTTKPTSISNISLSVVDDDFLVVDSHDASTRISFYAPDFNGGVGTIESFMGSSAMFEFDDNTEMVYVCVDKHNKIPYIIDILREDIYGERGLGYTNNKNNGIARVMSKKECNTIIPKSEFTSKQTGVIYDLQGGRLDHEPVHGLYIRNGQIYKK